MVSDECDTTFQIMSLRSVGGRKLSAVNIRMSLVYAAFLHSVYIDGVIFRLTSA
jgi:hypothetical protein